MKIIIWSWSRKREFYCVQSVCVNRQLDTVCLECVYAKRWEIRMDVVDVAECARIVMFWIELARWEIRLACLWGGWDTHYVKWMVLPVSVYFNSHLWHNNYIEHKKNTQMVYSSFFFWSKYLFCMGSWGGRTSYYYVCFC